ncbi:hypothetical protein [Paenarthrobacter nitroguajacolicus]|uniref:hypothetical protein n=1 Tax=Paenarthrobacter nitroguajacolicus TaxID=211146 RepID=UPI00248C2BC1|nr:hypothetical protein [Paenarthrobacter nitroguajacolicus]
MDSSLHSGWRYAEDWDIPEARDFAFAAVRKVSLREPARSLGYARSFQGAGITETIQDLLNFYEATWGRPSADVIQSLAEGWVSGSERSTPESCTDALTGLSTAAHFSRVLHDAYESGIEDPSRLLIVKIKLPALPTGAARMYAFLAQLGEACQEAFKGSGATVAYDRSAVLILTARTHDGYLRAFSCRAAIMNLLQGDFEAAEISYQPLPENASGLLELIAGLSE